MSSISKICIVGTGKMAFALGEALYNAGINVVEVYGRQVERAEELAEMLNSKIVNELRNLSTDVDAYFLLVSDDAIEEVSKQLPATVAHVHSSGVTNVDVLSSEVSGVVWPIKSINPKSMKNGFTGVPFAIEGTSEKFENSLYEAILRLKADAVKAKSADRSVIHLAAVFTDNFANHCLALSQKILSESKLEPALLRELATSMAEGAITGDSFERQTGVAVRGDLGSQQKHLDLIKDESLNEFYKFLSSHIAKHHEL